MSTSSDFFDYVRDQLSAWADIEKKRMFGLAGIYRDGLMFGIIANDKVYLKVNESTKSKFLEAGSAPLKVFKNKSTVKSYYELPEEVLDDADQLCAWADEAYMIQIKKM